MIRNLRKVLDGNYCVSHYLHFDYGFCEYQIVEVYYQLRLAYGRKHTSDSSATFVVDMKEICDFFIWRSKMSMVLSNHYDSRTIKIHNQRIYHVCNSILLQYYIKTYFAIADQTKRV